MMRYEIVWLKSNMYLISTVIKFGIKIITFYDKSSFLKVFQTRFEQIRSVHYQAISHTDN